jgi:hypothetical protein
MSTLEYDLCSMVLIYACLHYVHNKSNLCLKTKFVFFV